MFGTTSRIRSVMKVTSTSDVSPSVLTLQDAVLGDEISSKEHYTDVWRCAPTEMTQLESTYLRAQQFLDARDWKTVRVLIESAVSTALSIRDGSADADTSPPDREPIRRILRARARETRTLFDRSAERTARRRYARGLYGGVGLTLVLLVLLGVVAPRVVLSFSALRGRSPTVSDGEYLALRDTLVCIGGGAAGAVVSVVIRLRHVKRMDYTVVSRWAAAYRVVLGWFFATAVLFLIKGGILTIFTDPTAALLDEVTAGDEVSGLTVKSWFFWGGLGFLAGFNERWARNLLAREDHEESTESEEAGDDRQE